jgi:hypothetical protein
MGIEYQIRFARPSEPVLDRAIRSLPFFRDYDDNYQLYNLWLDRNDSRPGMPDAHAKIEASGIYFCDNCGPDVSCIRESLMTIAQQFDPTILLEEL